MSEEQNLPADAPSTIVLMHGSPGSPADWAVVAAELNPTYNVIIPPLPGHGTATRRPEGAEPTTEWVAKQLEVKLIELGGPPLLVGHAYGANVALHVALRGNTPLAGLVLIEPLLLGVLPISNGEIHFSMALRAMEYYASRVDAGQTDAIRHYVDHWYGPGAWSGLSAQERQALISGTATNLVDLSAIFNDQYRASMLATVNLPTCLMRGSGSSPTVVQIVMSLDELLPDSHVRSIRGARHNSMATHAQAVAGIIREHAQILRI